MDEILFIYKALADKNRLRILWALDTAGEMCACRLIELLGISGAAVSQHLACLVQAGLCTARKDGRWMRYSLKPHPLMPNFETLGSDPGLQKDRENLKAILAVSEQELCKKQREN